MREFSRWAKPEFLCIGRAGAGCSIVGESQTKLDADPPAVAQRIIAIHADPNHLSIKFSKATDSTAIQQWHSGLPDITVGQLYC